MNKGFNLAYAQLNEMNNLINIYSDKLTNLFYDSCTHGNLINNLFERKISNGTTKVRPKHNLQ